MNKKIRALDRLARWYDRIALIGVVFVVVGGLLYWKPGGGGGDFFGSGFIGTGLMIAIACRVGSKRLRRMMEKLS